MHSHLRCDRSARHKPRFTKAKSCQRYAITPIHPASRSQDSGDGKMSRMRTPRSILRGETGGSEYNIPHHQNSSITQMRSADEGSTILYTVRVCYPGYRPLIYPFSVRLLQTRVADQQLKKGSCARDAGLVLYTFTPTLQKRATTPKPPRILASDATAPSRIGILSFGRLWKRCISTPTD